MSAQKEEAKQRKRKSLKMALEKCMQRREAASTTISNIITNSTNTNTNTTLLTSTSTTTTTTNPTSTSAVTAATEAITSHAGSPQKRVKANVGHDMEAQETTETETSMDTSAEVNASDMCESREEDVESETSINSNAFKDTSALQTYRLQHEKVKSMEVEYDDKPLDFTTTPTKKTEANNVNDNDNEAKDVEAYLKSTAVIKETAKVLDCGNNDDKLEQIEKQMLDKEKEKDNIKDNDSDKNAEIQEKSASLKEN
ncbi:hypothetical protein DOY81_008059 [Sarcophaga bullata]|nr:hypothetical protein DOY81_008059 [Sarcophaga bullata]